MNWKMTSSIVLLTYFAVASIALSETIYVPADHSTIAAAIDASDNGDVIEVSSGIYNENSLDTSGKSITILGTIEADGTLGTIIDGNLSGSVFRFNSGEGPDTMLKNLVIRNGDSPQGGGIFCSGTDPTIKGCLLTGNYGYTGGGISCYYSDPTITNCILLCFPCHVI